MTAPEPAHLPGIPGPSTQRGGGPNSPARLLREAVMVVLGLALLITGVLIAVGQTSIDGDKGGVALIGWGIGGFGFLLIDAVFLPRALRKPFARLRRAVPVTATVDEVEKTGSSGTTLHVRFRLPTGEEVVAKATATAKAPAVGAQLTVRYDPQDPTWATTSSYELATRLLMAFAAFVVFSCVVSLGVGLSIR